MNTTPDEWLAAEQESPQDAVASAARQRKAPAVSAARRRVEHSTLLLATVIAIILTSLSWTAAELLGLFGSPWWAVPAGLLAALIIRLAAGPDDPGSRATASAIVYVLSFVFVMVLLTRREVHEIYGETNDVALLEQNLFRRRFSRIEQLAAYAIGWAAAWYTSVGLRR